MALFSLKAQISVGLKGGGNFANVNATQSLDNLIPDFQDITTFSVGGVAEIGITDQLAFQPELLYTRKGFGIRQSTDVNLFNIPLPLGVTAETHLDYLELPLLAKVKLGTNNINAFLTAGPTFGYATGGRLLTRANVLLDFTLVDTPINLEAINFQRFEIGGALGAGLEVDTEYGRFFAEARYNHGFSQLYDIPLVDERLRNRNIALSAGFLLPIR